MVKRVWFIPVLLIFGLIGFLPTKASGWNATAGGWLWNTYTMWFEIRGGGSGSAMEGTYMVGSFYVLDASLVCSNSGTNKKDVRGGLGGTTVITNTPIDNTSSSIDERGKFIVTSDEIYAERDEIPDNVLSPPQSAQDYFNALWGVDSSDCKSQNWDPFAYLVQRGWLTGTLWQDCDPNPPPSYDTTYCTDRGTVEFYCETLEDPRYWPGVDNTVRYICVDRGSPIAWDDAYSVRRNRTLNVDAPGVLENDSDGENDPLTAILVHDVSHGSLAWSSVDDGSFTYTPDHNYVGFDTFTYKANDGSNDSNEATVVITVY